MKIHIESLPIGAVRPYERNPRINAKAVPMVAESIREYGFLVPIVIDGDGCIVAGHTRLKAAESLGMTEVPCIRADHLTEDQVRQFRLVDNRTAEEAEWDVELLRRELEDMGIEWDAASYGFTDEWLSDLYADDDDSVGMDPHVVEVDPDPVDEVEPVTRHGDMWVLGRHRLLCGDATLAEDMDRLMDGTVADMVMTDPPYNVDYTGGTSKKLKIVNDRQEDSQFLAFLRDSYRQMDRNLRRGGAVYCWYTEAEMSNFITAFKDFFNFHEVLIWKKNSLVLGHLDYHKKHEPCLYGWSAGSHYFIDDRTQATVFEDKGLEPRRMKKDELVRLVEEMLSDRVSTTVIEEDRPQVNAEHPTMKPIRLLARLIKNSSVPDEVVLDPFGGSGSTLLTCEQIGRTCYTMELDPRYCDVIVARWERFTGLKAERVGEA